MHTGYISFCDNLGLNIKSHEVKETIARDLETKYKVKIIKKHFDKLDAHQLGRLQKNPHMVCLRSNGNPYYLYLTRYQNTNQCFFVDKKVQGGYHLPRIIISKLRFHDSLFAKDTLFEGEMVKDMHGNWVYLIHDLIGYQGVHLEKENIVKRINTVYDVLSTHFVPDETDVCFVQVKKYVTCDKIHDLVYDFMPTLPYTCRGMYFKPLFMKFTDVLMNFDDTLIKKVHRVKYQGANQGFLENKEAVTNAQQRSQPHEPEKAKQVHIEAVSLPQKTGGGNDSSKVFLIEKTPIVDVYNLYDAATKKMVGNAGVVTIATSRMLQDVFKSVNAMTKLQARCTLHAKFNKWVPLEIV